MTFELDKHGWDILDAYFANMSHYISKNQIDSFNMFTDEQISKTVRQFNPIQLNYNLQDNTEYEVDIMVGGSVDGENLINDGSSIKIAKPIIYEKYYDTTTNTMNSVKRQLYPNEARLKNLTYTMGVYVDVHCLYRKITHVKVGSPEVKILGVVSLRNKLLGKIPAMLHSKICVLSDIPQNNLKDFGECQYDQGGYFIIDGKEKVITAQTRQVENKVYVYEKVKDDKNEFHAEIRSVPEDKLQPARITNVYLKRPEQNINKGKGKPQQNKEGLLYVTIPNFKEQIPIFILFRALGVTADKEILEMMIGDLQSPLGEKLSNLLYDNILISNHITTQVDAFRYLQNIIRNFDGVNKKSIASLAKEQRNRYIANIAERDAKDFPYILDILYNYLLPHVGTSNLYDKAIFLGYMVNQILLTKYKVLEQTDRDNYMYKRIDVSGFLVATIFRDLYFRVQNNFKYRTNQLYVASKARMDDENILQLITDDTLSGIGDPILDSTIMTDGFKYAFKNCWGLRNAPCKEGVVQDLARLTYVGMTSHLRRVVTPIDASNKLRGPHMLHLSTYGILCPIETPDGANVGVKTNIAMFTDITFGTHSNGVYQALLDNGLIDCGLVKVVDVYRRNLTRVFLNGRLVGYTDKPNLLTQRLRLLRRNAVINIYTSIAWYVDTKEIKLSTDSGRSCHPMIIVKDNRLSITPEIFRKLMSGELKWNQLLGGTLRVWDQYDNKYHKESALSDSELVKTAGVIEFVDTEEANTCMVAMNQGELSNPLVCYTHCEISPAIMFGIMGQLIPYAQTNQLPRNLYSCGQCKQAIGIYASNFRNRMDTKTQILQYPEKPLVQNRLAKHLYGNQLPYGINVTVAIACYSGYNQDDSIIFNKSSLDRGMFKTTKFRTYAIREEVSDFTKLRSKICNPVTLNDPKIIVHDLKPGNYSKLDENGIVREGVKVDENDIVCGKVIITNERDAEGRIIYKDASEYVRRAETGIIDKVYYSYDNNDFLFVKVRLRKEKRPELGDKFASRAGQKGIMGMILHESDMPFTRRGIRPDMMINPQAFPKRMTISQFIETQQTKQCSLLGIFGDSSPFQDIPLDKMGAVLESLGFEKTGCEMLYNGMTGELLEHEIFIGPTYYGRLQHQVEDKMHSRDTGAVTMLTKQPTGGRSIGGGLRIGEMERDALLSHGVSGFLKESMMERSDKHSMIVCNGCGFIAMVNAEKHIYKCYSCNSTKVSYYDDRLHKDQIENSKNNFSMIELPYGMKLMTQELEAMSVASRVITYGESSKWQKVDKYTNTMEMSTQISSMFTSGDNTDIYRVTDGDGKDVPFRKYQNLVKSYLINGAQAYVTGGRLPHLLDLSAGKGGDMHKWILSDYGYVLALDQSETNVYGATDCLVNRLAQVKDKLEYTKFFSTNTIEYGLAMLNKSLYDGKAYSDTNMENVINLRKILKRRGKNSFDIVSLQFAIQNVFDNKLSLHNCLQNISDSVRVGGVVLISSMDGDKLYNNLKSNDLVFAYRDAVNRIPIYAINKMYDAKYDKLPSDDNSLGFKVNIQLGSSGKNTVEYLVSSKYLISEAKKFGLKIMDLSDFKQNFKYLRFPFENFTGSIDEIANTHGVSQKLLSDNYRELKEFSSFYNYFVFVKVATQALSSDNLTLCNKLTRVKISKSGLDDVLYERTLLGQVNTTPVPLPIIDRRLIPNMNSEYKYTELSLYKAIETLMSSTKTMIYCYIKNGKLSIYTPMYNSTNEGTPSALVIGENYDKILEMNLDKYRYYPELANKPIYSNKNVWYMSGCKLNLTLFEFNDLYYNTFKHMLDSLLNDRSIPDLEFVYHLESIPINRQTPDVSIFGLSTNTVSGDIPLPTPLDWFFITKQYFVAKDKCHNTYFDMRGIESQLPNWETRANKIIFRGSSKACGTTPSDNVRLQVLDYVYTNKLSNVDFKITQWDNSTILTGTSFSFTRGLRSGQQDPTLENFVLPVSESGDQYSLKTLASNKYILYLDSYGVSLKYSYLMTLGSVIVRLPSKNRLWYTGLTVPFTLDMTTVTNQDHILLEGVSELGKLSEWIVGNDVLAKKIAENSKKLAETIFNRKFIFDYMEYTFKLAHNKYNPDTDYSSYNINQHIQTKPSGGLVTKNIPVSVKLLNLVKNNIRKLEPIFEVELVIFDDVSGASNISVGNITVSGTSDMCDKFITYLDEIEDWNITRISGLNTNLVRELRAFTKQVENHYDVYILIDDNDVYVFGADKNIVAIREVLNNTLESLPLIAWYANKHIELNVDMNSLINIVNVKPVAIVTLVPGNKEAPNITQLMDYFNKHHVEYLVYNVEQLLTNELITNIPRIITQTTDSAILKTNYLGMLKAINGIIPNKYERLVVISDTSTITSIDPNFISVCERCNRELFYVDTHLLYIKSRFAVRRLPDLHFGMTLDCIPNIIKYPIGNSIINIDSPEYETRYVYDTRYDKLNLDYDVSKFYIIKRTDSDKYVVDFNANSLPVFLETEINIGSMKPFEYLEAYLEKFIPKEQLKISASGKAGVVNAPRRITYPDELNTLVFRIIKVANYLYNQVGIEQFTFVPTVIDDGEILVRFVSNTIEQVEKPMLELLPYFTIDNQYYIRDYTLDDAKQFSTALSKLKSENRQTQSLKLPTNLDKKIYLFITRVGDYVFYYNTVLDNVALYSLVDSVFLDRVDSVPLFKKLDTVLLLFIYKNNNDSMLKLILENKKPTYKHTQLNFNKLVVPELSKSKTTTSSVNKYDLLDLDISQNDYVDRIGSLD